MNIGLDGLEWESVVPPQAERGADHLSFFFLVDVLPPGGGSLGSPKDLSPLFQTPGGPPTLTHTGAQGKILGGSDPGRSDWVGAGHSTQKWNPLPRGR